MKYDIKLFAIFIGDKGTDAPNTPVLIAAVWEGGMLNFSESWQKSCYFPMSFLGSPSCPPDSGLQPKGTPGWIRFFPKCMSLCENKPMLGSR